MDQVFGTRERDKSTGCLMTVKTLFPSHVDEQGVTKGCMLLLKMKRNPLLANKKKEDGEEGQSQSSSVVQFKCTYHNAITASDESKVFSVAFPPLDVLQRPSDEEWFESHGVQKIIVLTHYINFCRAVIANVSVDQTTGVPSQHCPRVDKDSSSSNSSASGELLTSQLEVFDAFKDYFSNQCELLQDEFMKQEIVVLNKFIDQQKQKYQQKEE
ncbi:hypothetical protein RFI_17647 [Reticulomyxa filosa]|uniref:Uncharacterized protein n=1 Tax=Reticulomyxa filosa TaxID=46433 RepID=X6N1H2_RETFI|nr:hypothetical protein RFI_17647 [Reticulomyxa filosa]|eukprot:ETO19584.1 hypothetical protein RFI_17647 [Reticulomyxa filosa]